MRILDWKFGRAPLHPLLRPVENAGEARSDSATNRVRHGKVLDSIYGAFDDRLGKTVWRFSLLKHYRDPKTKRKYFRRSFEIQDANDVLEAMRDCVAYISRVQGL